MCFYRATVYECKHNELGKKVTICKLQRDLLKYTEDNAKTTCIERRVHSMNCVRKARVCDKCQRLDTLKGRTQEALDSLKETLIKGKFVDDDSEECNTKALEDFEAVEIPKIGLESSDDDSIEAHETFEVVETSKLGLISDEPDDEDASSSKAETSMAPETSEIRNTSEASNETVETTDTSKNLAEDADTEPHDCSF
ncbi:hypothetical protein BDP81DRAFT_392399 [Colletotrichum phormii]|uniref:Uncharacterized protein n=1 Tax=Colletotrichum phormii TaxID=359342 RepID=A0AAI9ZYS7_9PEZI|nr:uncharacterized protein BDP81DRAFT_392399 [Colletotrichum phormii]KAK1639017.1 hypothetical protein BDP81DRAFT_392399 [Colletotrichum phormii]